MFNKQKKYFKRKLEGIQKMIWDYEFKKYKSLELREELRQEYDAMKSRLAALEETLKNEELKKDVDNYKRVEDQKVLLVRDIGRKEDQMKALDAEIEGAAPTNDNPEGVVGINQAIDGLRELQSMTKDYLKLL